MPIVETPRFAAWSGAPPLTVGVEEEFLLLDAATGEVAAAAPRVLALLGDRRDITPELTLYQIETATGVCTSLDQVRDELVRLRNTVSRAAARAGYHLVASGVAPLRLPPRAVLTSNPRYRELARRYPRLVSRSITCGCHVHVGVSSRDQGVDVIARLRPWLPTLLALSANSPIADGRDTRWASWRFHRWSEWPSAVPPRSWRSAARYDAAVRRLVHRGRAIDARGVYFHARLSPRYPTVEVRVMDTCLTVEDTLLLAALVRALAAAAADDAHRGVPRPAIPDDRLRAALDHAAREGLAGTALDPLTGRVTSQRELLERMIDRVPISERVAALLRVLLKRGAGADRQRAMWSAARTPPRFAALLADATRDAPMSV